MSKYESKLLKKRGQVLALFHAMNKGEISSSATLSLGGSKKKRKIKSKILETINKGGSLVLKKLIQFVLIAIFLIWCSFMGYSFGTVSNSPSLFTNAALVLHLFLGLIMCGYYIINVLYFSKDISFYLSLPIKSNSFYRTKIASIYYNFECFSILMVVCFFLAASVAAKLDFVSIVKNLFVTIIAINYQFILIVICINLIVSSLKSLNKDKFTSIISLIVMLLSLGIGVLVQFMQPNDANGSMTRTALEEVNNLINNRHTFGAINLIYLILAMPAFFYNLFMKLGLNEILALLISIIPLLLVIVINNIYGKKFYLRTVLRLESAPNKKSNKKYDKNELSKLMSKRSSFKALFDYDFKLITRTPMYKQQLIYGSLLFPVFYIVIFGVAFIKGSSTGSISLKAFMQLREVVNKLTWNSDILPFIVFGAMAVAVFMMMGNSSSTFIITRDGSNFYLFKSMPVNFKKYIMSKVMMSLLLITPTIFILIVLAIISGLSIDKLAYILAIIVFSMINACVISAAMDIFNPSLNWSSEEQIYRSGRGAIAVYGALLIGILLYIPEGLIAYLYFAKQMIPMNILYFLLIGLAILKFIISIFILIPKYEKKLLKTE